MQIQLHTKIYNVMEFFNFQRDSPYIHLRRLLFGGWDYGLDHFVLQTIPLFTTLILSFSVYDNERRKELDEMDSIPKLYLDTKQL